MVIRIIVIHTSTIACLFYLSLFTFAFIVNILQIIFKIPYTISVLWEYLQRVARILTYEKSVNLLKKLDKSFS
jgi:hypothetical protein